MTCHDCERHKLSASMWRNEAYKHAGTPLPWKPEELLREEYERGFIDGMQKQMQSSVDKAVNAMAQPEQEPVAWLEPEWGEKICPEIGYEVTITDDHPRDLCWIPLVPVTPPQRPWVGLTDEEIKSIEETTTCLGDESWLRNLTRNLETKLKEKNHG